MFPKNFMYFNIKYLNSQIKLKWYIIWNNVYSLSKKLNLAAFFHKVTMKSLSFNLHDVFVIIIQ